MAPPAELSAVSQEDASGRLPSQSDARAAGPSAAREPRAELVTSSDPDSDTSDSPTDQSSDSLARSRGTGPAERASRAAPAHQALNSRVRLPMSVRLPAAPGSSHDSTQDSAQESAQESTQESAQDSAQDSATASDSDSKGTASGGSLTYVTPDEYIRQIQPRPAPTRASHRHRPRRMSYSSESPELYFQNGRKYGQRSYGGLCLSMSIVAVIVAVIGIVSVAAYLGVATQEDGKALQYEMQYSGQFRVLSGDFYHRGLDDAQSNDFKHKATRYQRMLESVYGASYISQAFRRAEVQAFDGRPLTVFFRIHLDRRKIPRSVLNLEEALRDVLTQEVMAIQPKAFSALQLDINSIRISREKSWLGASPVLGADGRSAPGRTGEDSTEPAAAATPRGTEGGAAPTGGVLPGDVYRREDWVGPPPVGSVTVSGVRAGDAVTLTGAGAGAGTDSSPALRGRPITEYQPSEYGDFPPALVGGDLDLASAATVASHHWRTDGVRGTGRPGVEEGGRHRLTPGTGQTDGQSHPDGDGSTPGGSRLPPHPHHRPRPGGDSSEAGVMTRPAGADRAAPRPSPPDIVPFIDQPSLQRPEYDRTPWQPVLSSRGQGTPGQRAPELEGLQAGGAPTRQGQGSVRPAKVTGHPEGHHRGPGQIRPDREEAVRPVSEAPVPQTENVRPRPGFAESNPEPVLPVAFWPKPAPPRLRPPPPSSRPALTVPPFLPSADKLGAGLLQMLSEFVLARTKPGALSRTEPTGHAETEQGETQTEQVQTGTEQSQPETEQSQPATEQPQPETEQSESSDIGDDVKTEESATLPPLTVVLQPVPTKSKEASHKTVLSASSIVKEETSTDIQSETTKSIMKTTKLPASEGSSGTSSVPDIIITFSAVNSTLSDTEKLSEKPSVYLPDKMVRKTLTIVAKDSAEDSPYVTHPSGIISKAPLGSGDLLDYAMPPTTASPSEEGHHTEMSEVSAQVTRSEVSVPTGLIEDGHPVTSSSAVSFQTVPPHLHYRLGAGAAGAETAEQTPAAPSPPGDTSRPVVTGGDTTVIPEEDWERDGHVTKPFFQPVTSYSGVYPPNRPKPPSLPHPEYPSTHSNPALSFTSGEEEDEDYFYYDTEIFTEKNSVQSIFDMFSTRKPLVLDTDVVTSTSVREQATPERRLLLGLLRGASRRHHGSGRSRRPNRRTKMAAANKQSKATQLKERGNGTTPVLDQDAINEVNVSAPNRRERRSLSWLRMSSPREDQHDLSEPVSEPASRRHAARSLPHPTQTPASSQEAASAHLSEYRHPDDIPSPGALSARRVRRPPYSAQSVASLAARLRLAATPTARPRRGSRLRLPPRREKLADKLMRFRGVRSRGIFATTARPERRWRAEQTTRLPNSSPIQVIRYDEGATVDDILDRIFETRREFDSSRENEVGLAEGAGKEAASTPSSSALWRTSEAGEAWQSSEKTEQWSPVNDSVPWSTSEESSASHGIDRIGLAAESAPSSELDSRLTVNRFHSKGKTQTGDITGEDGPKTYRPAIRPPARLTARPAVRPSSRPPVRSSSRPARPASRPARPTSRPTVRPSAPLRSTTARPVHQWRPVRFRLPTQSDWPKATEPPRLADKLSRLTTTPGPAVVSARPAPAAAGSQLVADTDNEVGTAARPSAVVPTRPTLASLLSNYTYLEDGLTPPAAGCPGDQFRCVSGECVPRLSRCDLLEDCADGSDELVCTCADRLNAQFLERKICDGIIDCHDSTDEQFCDWCRPGQFICPGAKRCVPSESVCDGEYDCPDGADEHQCVTLAATRGAAGQPRYQPSGYLMVRRRGRWGPICVDNFDALVRRTRTEWSVQELGGAVCGALTYNQTTRVIRTEPSSTGRKRRQRQRKPHDDPFYQLVLSADAPRNNTDDTSLLFEEASCPRRTSVHITCDSLKCGLRPRVKQRRARIVGGTNSSPGAWPWQAAMYRDGEYQCGATLISDRWLLSAGHCFLRSATNHWVARLGAYRRGSTLLSPFESLHQVSHIIVHPDYEDVGYVHDIALLKLADTVSMSDFVRPVCLPPRRAEVTEGALCSVVGWGQLFESGRIFPDTLQEVELPLITSQQCKKRTSRLPLYKITDDMFCAGYDRGGRDACLGDSGGPLMCQEPSGEWTLTGITSNGYGCARALRPGVYTKVANYVDWIERVTTGPLPRARRTRCRGHRCPLGRCLKRDKVCDGVVDCADGSDEQRCSPAA